MLSLTSLLLALIAYLMGSICSAIILCRLLKLPDPTQFGSGNPGATNVYRLGGWFPASLTLLIDALKGAIPVLLAIQLNCTPIEQGMVGMFAICGHMLPIFFKFRGGKGVATTLGAGLAMAWPTTIALTLIWISIFSLSKISSIASLTAAILAPVISLLMSPDYTAIFLIISMLIVIRHRSNVINILRHQEQKLAIKKRRPPPH